MVGPNECAILTLYYTSGMIAAGLAGYAKTTQRREVNDLATKHYIAAIRGINAALSDQETATQDSTLMSVVLVAMFEVLIGPYTVGISNSGKHIDGAVTIALLIVQKGRSTDITHKLLTTLVQCLVMSMF